MAAPILWTPGKKASVLQAKNNVHKIPRFRGGGFWVFGFFWGGSADSIFMGARILLNCTVTRLSRRFWSSLNKSGDVNFVCAQDGQCFGNPNPYSLSKKYGSTPPICIAVLSWLHLPFVLQYASHLYGSAPPICTAVLLEKYWGLGSPERFDKTLPTTCRTRSAVRLGMSIIANPALAPMDAKGTVVSFKPCPISHLLSSYLPLKCQIVFWYHCLISPVSRRSA